MRRYLSFVLSLLIIGSVVALIQPALPANAAPIGNDAFERTWARTDKPVWDHDVNRTWMWGPQPFTELIDEEYAESPDDTRQVQYFDKSRMEITDPNAPDDGLWYVTNGLLVMELITGRMQIGDDTFIERGPSHARVAGDPNNPSSPTYAAMSEVLDRPTPGEGQLLNERIDREGQVTIDPALNAYGVVSDELVVATNHTVAEPFSVFTRSVGVVYTDGGLVTEPLFQNPFYATGYPITDAYWATVPVGGVDRDVLIQCFERRCLTYTPDNPEGWQVEAGNVGRHYYDWRYLDWEAELAGGVLATFEVGGELFKVWVTNPATIAQLEALRDGTGTARIPVGPVRYGSGQAQHNTPWNWHLDPDDVVLAGLAIELCDGTPSYVEAHMEEFVEIIGGYCPWGSELVHLADYR